MENRQIERYLRKHRRKLATFMFFSWLTGHYPYKKVGNEWVERKLVWRIYI